MFSKKISNDLNRDEPVCDGDKAIEESLCLDRANLDIKLRVRTALRAGLAAAPGADTGVGGTQ